ncbi:MAG: methyl-accepting chemotaxis protein, partial [Lachnospiraceae bacterium]|nr:methyl-accepting chemotaxis protein [Lachnospiraceae bacterium]
MQKKRKKRHNFSIQYKIMGITLLPLLFLGVVVIVIAQTLVKNAMIDEVQSTLKSSAEAMYAAYDQNTGDYFQAKNGDVWKGGYNISQSSGMLDAFKKDANTEITFFYGDKRVVTTAKDKKGKRILGSPAGTRIKRQVLEKGENYFSTHVKINNTMYFGYYIPVYQDGSKTPIGMIFAGVEKNAKMQSIMLIIGTVVAFVLICMALGMIVAMLISMSISKSLKKSIQVVEKVSEGDLCVEIDAGLMKRKDEIGDLSISMNALKEKLKDSIETIKTNTQQVLQASSVLEDVSTNTVQSVNEVEQVVRQIAGNADNQAVMASEASDNVAIMGEKIQHTSSKVQQMRQQADNMQSAEKRALVTIDKLMNSNEQVQNLIRAIAMQTQQTNESANHIREAVDIIS